MRFWSIFGPFLAHFWPKFLKFSIFVFNFCLFKMKQNGHKMLKMCFGPFFGRFRPILSPKWHKMHISVTKHRVKMASTIFLGSFEPDKRKRFWPVLAFVYIVWYLCQFLSFFTIFNNFWNFAIICNFLTFFAIIYHFFSSFFFAIFGEYVFECILKHLNPFLAVSAHCINFLR